MCGVIESCINYSEQLCNDNLKLGSGTAIDEEFYSLIVFVGLHELLDSEMHTVPPVMIGIGGDIDALVFDIVTT